MAIAGAGGGIEHLAIQYVRAMGLRPLGLDAGKRDICTKFGAVAYIDVTETQEAVAEIIKITEGGAHGALICAPSGQA